VGSANVVGLLAPLVVFFNEEIARDGIDYVIGNLTDEEYNFVVGEFRLFEGLHDLVIADADRKLDALAATLGVTREINIADVDTTLRLIASEELASTEAERTQIRLEAAGFLGDKIVSLAKPPMIPEAAWASYARGFAKVVVGVLQMANLASDEDIARYADIPQSAGEGMAGAALGPALEIGVSPELVGQRALEQFPQAPQGPPTPPATGTSGSENNASVDAKFDPTTTFVFDVAANVTATLASQAVGEVVTEWVGSVTPQEIAEEISKTATSITYKVVERVASNVLAALQPQLAPVVSFVSPLIGAAGQAISVLQQLLAPVRDVSSKINSLLRPGFNFARPTLWLFSQASHLIVGDTIDNELERLGASFVLTSDPASTIVITLVNYFFSRWEAARAEKEHNRQVDIYNVQLTAAQFGNGMLQILDPTAPETEQFRAAVQSVIASQDFEHLGGLVSGLIPVGATVLTSEIVDSRIVQIPLSLACPEASVASPELAASYVCRAVADGESDAIAQLIDINGFELFTATVGRELGGQYGTEQFIIFAGRLLRAWQYVQMLVVSPSPAPFPLPSPPSPPADDTPPDNAQDTVSAVDPRLILEIVVDAGVPGDRVTSDGRFFVSCAGGRIVDLTLDNLPLPPADGIYDATVDGEHHVSATCAGSSAVVSKDLDFDVDTKPPKVDVTFSDTGRGSSDGLTNDGRVNVTCDDVSDELAAELVNEQLFVKVDGTAIDVQGSLSVDFVVLGDGVHRIETTCFDRAGNSTMKDVEFALDTRNPLVNVDLERDSGFSSSDRVTKDGRIVARCFDDYLAAGSLLVAVDGVPVESSENQVAVVVGADGLHDVSAVCRDDAGNLTIAPTFSFTLDTMPSQVELDLVDDSGSSDSDRVTQNGLFAATCDDGSLTVRVNGSEVPLSSNGTFDLDHPGNYRVSAECTDVAGNVSMSSSDVQVDKDIPLPPRVALINDSGKFAIDRITFDGRVQVSGTDGTLAVFVDGRQSATDSAGVLTVTTEGAHLIEVRSRDVAGNEARATLSFTLDTTAPMLSVRFTDTGVSDTDRITRDGRVSVSGDGSLSVVVDGVVVRDSAGVVDVRGDGRHQVRATAEDLAGNVKSAAVDFLLDTVGPRITGQRLVSNRGRVSEIILNFDEDLAGSATSDQTIAVFTSGRRGRQIPVASVGDNGPREKSLRLAKHVRATNLVVRPQIRENIVDVAGNALSQD